MLPQAFPASTWNSRAHWMGEHTLANSRSCGDAFFAVAALCGAAYFDASLYFLSLRAPDLVSVFCFFSLCFFCIVFRFSVFFVCTSMCFGGVLERVVSVSRCFAFFRYDFGYINVCVFWFCVFMRVFFCVFVFCIFVFCVFVLSVFVCVCFLFCVFNGAF